ncbi:HPr kinase/phosphorylase [Azospirillum soli]|uniref:HPr kinase/phosphorylase n=1 Tax=Azospirillum soli TaxID=1304799 RepID=UPI001AE9EE88|nr:HPr kinase/phosphatase C-terminal domain-containing protein [Azospirillum soli]MBP2316217.1 serine kinase of HPr protein (carbohydrate metabolism regulator) [Azospirillum soli]
MVTIHGTCVLVSGIGVLLRGASGSGKSDVALRLIDGGAQLIADDGVELRMVQGRLMATAPAALAGLLEVRGVGILAVPTAPEAEVRLVVDLVPRGEVERLPDPETATLLEKAVPRLALHPFDASTTAKLRFAAAAARAGTLGEIPSPP